MAMGLAEAIALHGWLMYACFGILFPAGIIYARIFQHARQREASATTVANLFRVHVMIQVVGAVAMTVGAVLAFKDFGYNFAHTHERLGLALWIVIWAQCLVSFLLRPRAMGTLRVTWYMNHWLLGMGATIVGFYNIFAGMEVWERVFKSSIRTFNIAFTIQVALTAFIYFFVDRWDNFLLQSQKPTQVLPFSTNNPFLQPVVEIQEKPYA